MLNVFKPGTEELQKYIAFYYVFSGDRPANISYAAFPHINYGLSLFRNVTISRGDHEVYIDAQPNAAGNVHIEILGKYTKPVLVHYSGNVDEVAIIFKPLGINQFLKGLLLDYIPQYSQALVIDSWNDFALRLFNEPSVIGRINLLDEFLSANVTQARAVPIANALHYLEDTETEFSIAQIAHLIGMNLKTFQRHFLKNMGCSPNDYKRIARFRKSVNSKLLSAELKNLTKITYENKYYDQSYFIREFKKLTHLNPGNFFRAITVLNEEGIFWEVV